MSTGALQISECCARSFVNGVGARVSDFFHFADYEFEFLVAGVEMWRDAHAGAGTIVDDKLASNQFAGNRRRVLVADSDCAAAVRCVLWTRHSKSGLFRQLNQMLRLSRTLGADFF